MTKEQNSRKAGIKEVFQLWIAETIAGQEFTFFNSVLVRLAGKEIQPILMDEINKLLSIDLNNIRKVDVYDKDNMGPSDVGLFGLSINQVSEKLHFARPFLSKEKIEEVREIISRAVKEYQRLKGKLEGIKVIEDALYFIKEVEDINKELGLEELNKELELLLSQVVLPD